MKKIAILSFAILIQASALATHLRCGDISIKKLNNGLTYTIKLTIYTNLGSQVRFEGGTLRFGDGSSIITPRVESKVLNKDSGLGVVEFSANHTYPGPGRYTISYQERNLNAGILNVSNAIDTPFFLKLTTIIDPLFPDNSSPLFLMPPVFVNTTNQPYSISNAAYDVSGGYIRYQLGMLYQANNILALGFKLPKNLSVNYYNGLVTWDNKLDGDIAYEGEYLFVLDIYHFNSSNILVNRVQRLFQILLQDQKGKIEITNPISDPNGKIFVESGKSKTIKVLMEGDTAKKTWILANHPSISKNIVFTQYDSIVNSSQVRVGAITLNSTPEIIQNEPYAIVLRAKSGSDGNPNPIYKDVSFLFFTKDITLPPKPDPEPDPIVTEIDNTNVNNLNVYPNPFHDYLYLTELPEDGHREVSIYNQLGQLVLTANKATINTTSLPAGIYFLRSDTFVTKLIKQ